MPTSCLRAKPSISHSRGFVVLYEHTLQTHRALPTEQIPCASIAIKRQQWKKKTKIAQWRTRQIEENPSEKIRKRQGVTRKKGNKQKRSKEMARLGTTRPNLEKVSDFVLFLFFSSHGWGRVTRPLYISTSKIQGTHFYVCRVVSTPCGTCIR